MKLPNQFRAVPASMVTMGALMGATDYRRRVGDRTRPLARMVLATCLVVVLASLFVAVPADARTPVRGETCRIAKWNANGVSGGCTCWVASNIGVDIPWSGNAGQWWANAAGYSSWTRSSDEPRVNSIAAWNFGHVGLVSSVAKTGESRTTIRTEQAQVGSRTETYISGYRDEWRIQNKKSVKVRVAVYSKRVVPIYATIKTEQVTESYRVTSTNMDYYYYEKGVFMESWTATRTYTVRNGASQNDARWSTPRSGYSSASNGMPGYSLATLQGYIYHR